MGVGVGVGVGVGAGVRVSTLLASMHACVRACVRASRGAICQGREGLGSAERYRELSGVERTALNFHRFFSLPGGVSSTTSLSPLTQSGYCAGRGGHRA